MIKNQQLNIKLMKKTILLLLGLSLSLLITPLQANEIRAGAISLKQLITLNVEATVQIVLPSHADITDLELCWGDGICTSLQQSNETTNAAQGLKYYTFTDTHTYPAMGAFTTSIDHCCYDGSISNITNGAASNFQIETMIVLLSNPSGDLNTTPTFTNAQSLVDVGIVTEILVLFGADADVENDVYNNEICEPENVTDYSGIDFPNSTVTLAPTGAGVLVWSNPGFQGVYIVQICTDETRNGALISSSKRIVNFVVDNEFVSKTTALSDLEVLVYPNPVSGGKLYLERKGSIFMDGANVLLTSSLGVNVFSGEWNGLNEMAIEVGDLPKGYYTVVLLLEDGTSFYKQIVI
jgi:hypothetical protein